MNPPGHTNNRTRWGVTDSNGYPTAPLTVEEELRRVKGQCGKLADAMRHRNKLAQRASVKSGGCGDNVPLWQYALAEQLRILSEPFDPAVGERTGPSS